MSKSPAKTVSTEVVVAGLPSTALLAELKRVGSAIKLSQLADAINHLEAARVGFVSEAVAAGLLLLAKKQTCQHGEWQGLCAEIWAELGNRKRVSHLDSPAALHNFTRSLRGYTFIAQHFLADLEQGNFQADGELPANPPALKPAEVLALDTLEQEQRIAVYGAIERFVAGRSLRRMLMDFRRAESAADLEETQEAAAAAEAAAKRGKGRGKGDTNQLDFFSEMTRPIDAIDTLFETPSFVKHTTKAFWNNVADRLTDQAARARQMAKEIRA